MTASLDRVLGDLQTLNQRLKTRDSDADAILQQAQTVQARLLAMQRYQEEVLSLSEIAAKTARRTGSGVSNHRQLLLSMAAENKQVEQLRTANMTLQKSLNEHQDVVELMMSKYRTQMAKLLQENRVAQIVESTLNGDNSHMPSGVGAAVANKTREVAHLRQTVAHLAAMASDMTEQCDQYTVELQEELHRLQVENRGLREVLVMSATRRPSIIVAGSGPTSNVTTSDKDGHLQQALPGSNAVHLSHPSLGASQLAGSKFRAYPAMVGGSGVDSLERDDADDMTSICSALNSVDVRLAEVEAVASAAAAAAAAAEEDRGSGMMYSHDDERDTSNLQSIRELTDVPFRFGQDEEDDEDEEDDTETQHAYDGNASARGGNGSNGGEGGRLAERLHSQIMTVAAKEHENQLRQQLQDSMSTLTVVRAKVEDDD